MKKTLAIILVLLLGISLLAGCGSNDSGGNSTPESAEQAQTSTPEPTPTPEPEPTPTPEPEPAEETVTIYEKTEALTFTIPLEGWCYKFNYRGETSRIYMYPHNPPVKDSYAGNAPSLGISIPGVSVTVGVKPDSENVLRLIDNRVIGGADCEGLIHKHAAGDSFQYVGKLSDTHNIYIYGTGIDPDDPVVSAILDSITFDPDFDPSTLPPDYYLKDDKQEEGDNEENNEPGQADNDEAEVIEINEYTFKISYGGSFMQIEMPGEGWTAAIPGRDSVILYNVPPGEETDSKYTPFVAIYLFNSPTKSNPPGTAGDSVRTALEPAFIANHEFSCDLWTKRQDGRPDYYNYRSDIHDKYTAYVKIQGLDPNDPEVKKIIDSIMMSIR